MHLILIFSLYEVSNLLLHLGGVSETECFSILSCLIFAEVKSGTTRKQKI